MPAFSAEFLFKTTAWLLLTIRNLTITVKYLLKKNTMFSVFLQWNYAYNGKQVPSEGCHISVSTHRQYGCNISIITPRWVNRIHEWNMPHCQIVSSCFFNLIRSQNKCSVESKLWFVSYPSSKFSVYFIGPREREHHDAQCVQMLAAERLLPGLISSYTHTVIVGVGRGRETTGTPPK